MELDMDIQLIFFQVEFPQDILLIVIRIAFIVGATFTVNQILGWIIDSRKLDRASSRQIKIFLRIIILAFAILALIAALGFDPTVAVAGAGVLAFAISFAAQDLLSNFVSGIFLIFGKTFSVNDVVRVGDTYGVVRLVSLRSTQIKTFDGNIVIVPNSTVAKSSVINMTSGSEFMLTSVVVRIGYGEDLHKVINIMENAIPEDDRIHIEEKSDLMFEFQDIGDSSLLGNKVIMYFKVEALQEPWIRSKVQARVIKALFEEKIEFQRRAGDMPTMPVE